MEDERHEEIDALVSIFPELIIDKNDPYTFTLSLAVSPTLFVTLSSKESPKDSTTLFSNSSCASNHVKHLPPMMLQAHLPESYPNSSPPRIKLHTTPSWLDQSTIQKLEAECEKLWNEYGQCQILYTYIDYLQQAAERIFDLGSEIEVPAEIFPFLVTFNDKECQKIFDQGTYDCGVCLEPRKGTLCHRMEICCHIFCKPCLQSFYNSAIDEGNINTIACLEPSCGKKKESEREAKKRPLHPRELLSIGINEIRARRYVELKRKKKLESDQTTIYCPREWCQAPARSNKYPPIPDNLMDYIDVDQEMEAGQPVVADNVEVKAQLPVTADRLVICSEPTCALAFCRICYAGWHGDFARCWPRKPTELTPEERATYEYLKYYTSPCPTCSSPTQKTMGCNHMKCFQCDTHFCYLCGAWLMPGDPYRHFNTKGSTCYMRLWELEEGDGQINPQEVEARRADRERAAAEAALLLAEQLEEEAVMGEIIAAIDPPMNAAVHVQAPPRAPPLQPPRYLDKILSCLLSQSYVLHQVRSIQCTLWPCD